MTDVKTEKKIEGNASFEITISSQTVLTSYAKQLKKVAEGAEIKGFRKGKAPVDLVEKQIDKSKIYNYVLDEILPPVYTEGLKKNNVIPLSEPRITPIKMEEGKDWVFKVEVAVKPDFKLGDYQKFVKKALADHSKEHKHEESKDQKEREHKKEHTLGIVFDSLLKNIEFPVSPILVEDESKNALSRLVNQLTSLKLSIDDYVKSIKKTKEELVKEYEETALTNLRLEFIIQAIVEDLKPEVTDQEVAELKPGNGQESYARYLVSKRKALDFLSEL